MYLTDPKKIVRMYRRMVVGAGVLMLWLAGPVMGDFGDDFESYDAGGGLPLPWSLSAAAPMVVNMSGWQGSQGVFGQSTNWQGSARPTGYDANETCYELSLKARISSANSLARHNWAVGNGTETLFFEMDQNTMLITFAGGSAALAEDVWYEFSIALCRDAGGNWAWHGSYRVWTGAGWAGWVIMGSGDLAGGFAPETVTIGGIYALGVGDPGNSAMDEVAFRAVVEPVSCYAAIAGGYGQTADLNEDCYVDLSDFALVVQDWLECMNPADAACE